MVFYLVKIKCYLVKIVIIYFVFPACHSGKWGLLETPSCSNDCPICLNGGICDERSGVCVCAPGFSGMNCETGK